jgi:hypothetical protein
MIPSLFIPSSRRNIEKPVFLDRAPMVAELIRLYPAELRSSGVGGAVLVHVDIDEYGSVIRANARSPRMIGFLPRPKPVVYNPGNGEIMRRLVWTDDPVLLRIAEEASLRARFVPGKRGDYVVAWGDHPVVCYFAADPVLGRQDHDVPTGVLNT